MKKPFKRRGKKKSKIRKQCNKKKYPISTSEPYYDMYQKIIYTKYYTSRHL